jgi:predicted adenine nucleotide alpha hydrolase (AANH) superfamily ATPase
MLLHACCAPCLTRGLDLLSGVFCVTVFFYNPNLAPQDEYDKRLENVRVLVAAWNAEYGTDISLVLPEYVPQEFLSQTNGLEAEPENGARCSVCYALRLEETARYAKQNGFDCFSTTLTTGSRKPAAVINPIGAELGRRLGVPFFETDLKKADGYKKSLVLSEKYGLYRQHYCGCAFSSK